MKKLAIVILSSVTTITAASTAAILIIKATKDSDVDIKAKDIKTIETQLQKILDDKTDALWETTALQEKVHTEFEDSFIIVEEIPGNAKPFETKTRQFKFVGNGTEQNVGKYKGEIILTDSFNEGTTADISTIKTQLQEIVDTRIAPDSKKWEVAELQAAILDPKNSEWADNSIKVLSVIENPKNDKPWEKRYLITIEGTGNDTNTGKYNGQIELEQNIELSEMEEGFTWYIDQTGEIAKTNEHDFSKAGLNEVDVILKLGFYRVEDETRTIQYFKGTTVPKELPKEITTLDRFFANNENEYINGLDKWNTSNVTSMRGVFESCLNLTTLDLINWNTSNVTSSNGTFDMFSNCQKLTTLNIAGWDTSNVEQMSGMFFNCWVLEVDCSAWVVGKRTDHIDFNTNAPGVIPPTWVN